MDAEANLITLKHLRVIDRTAAGGRPVKRLMPTQPRHIQVIQVPIIERRGL